MNCQAKEENLNHATNDFYYFFDNLIYIYFINLIVVVFLLKSMKY